MKGEIAIVATLFAMAGCGGPQPSRAPNPSPSPSPSRSPLPSQSPSPPPLPTLDSLAARAPSLAPGMREALRASLTEASPTPLVLVRADAADTCVRVALVASPAVTAVLKDARGDLLAQGPPTTDAPIAAKGPVCVRKGDAISLVVSAQGAWQARLVAWASP